MIVTVTLNPALDKTIQIDNFRISEVNRVISVREDAGGKGINVSNLVNSLGGDTIATGAVAGPVGDFIEKQLTKLGTPHDFVHTEGNTRTNTKVVDITLKTYTDINEPGVPLSEEVLNQIEEKIFKYATEDGIVVFSGSIPKNVGKDIYGRWIEKVKAKGIKTILDADGELLQKGLEAGPYLIKPNVHELEMLYDKKFETMEEAILFAKGLLKYGIEIIALSMGGDGCAFITKDKTYFAKAIPVEVKSTVGAGDSMVAALAYAIQKNTPLEEAIKLAVAAATASITNEGTQMGTKEQIEFWRDKVEFELLVL